jgi:hypothetical protein
MKLVLHFGAHKTGTTLLQEFMTSHAAFLKANRIACLKRYRTNVVMGHSKTITPDRNFDMLAQILRKRWWKRDRAYIVSHEKTIGMPFRRRRPGLYPDRDTVLEILSKTLAKYDTRIIYYIRSQEELIESYYLESIAIGEFRPFEKWRKRVKFDQISWKPVVKSLEDAFGADRVIIRDFRTEMANGPVAFVESFFRLVLPDIDGSKFQNLKFDSKPVNPGFGDKGYAIASAVNRFLVNREERRALKRFIQENFSNRKYPRPVLLSDETKAAIRERYAAENAALITKAIPGPEAEPGLLAHLVSGFSRKP